MSLVDALQVSPARSRRIRFGVASNFPFYSPKMNGGVRVEVTLLDGHKLEFSVGTRLRTQELIALVSSHFALRESQYFSLAFKDNTGHYHWLVEDWKLLEHDFARGVRVLPLHFLVRFFPENITDLRDAQAVEMMYQQARNLVAKGQLEVEHSTIFRLAAYAIQASFGDFIQEATTKSYLKRLQLLPLSGVEEQTSHSFREDKVCEHHRSLVGYSRGDAILSYMKEVEAVPGYGVHFYEVRDRAGLPWYLGINQKGVAQYDYLDKRKPRRIFLWKQLENLYLRERKFSIEVHDPKRVSVSRRTFGPGNVCVYVWFAGTPALCKSIWSMAIAQHQFYLDRKSSKTKDLIGVRGEPLDLAGELSRSCLSLSTPSSPNLSRSGSHSSLQQHSHTEESVSTESLHAARMEMIAALQQRYDTLQDKLKAKTEELKLLCLREGELTGEIPPEYPIKPGEPPPTVRKRVGTSFALDENLINKIINKQDETVASLELEYEIQGKITSAALKLASDTSTRKVVRKQRKISHSQAVQRLKDLELKLNAARSRQAQIISNNASTMPKMKKKPRPVSDGEGIQDDTYISLGSSSLSSQECHKDTSFVEGVSLSPAGGSYSHFPPALNPQLKTKISTVSLHSAPPSPQRGSSVGHTPSESSSQPTISEESRSSSPGRPTSGYIPSCVYTLSQYRTQQYPTLSTRGQSVQNDGLNHHHHRSFNGELFNLPQQRTSIASHSLDDLDTSIPNPQIVKSPANHLPPQHTVPPQCSPNQYYSHHHHFDHHHHHYARRPKTTDTQDRYGSLDRRRAASGRLESRSLEQLDADSPQTTPKIQTPHTPQTPIQTLEYAFPYEPREAHIYPVSVPNRSFESSSCDTVDSIAGHLTPKNAHMTPTDISYIDRSPYDGEMSNGRSFSHQKLNRAMSGRHPENNYFFGHQFSYNQENIPPSPLGTETTSNRATNSCQRTFARGDPHSTNLRPTASVSAADHVRPFRIPASDLQPLRATKSSVELPPLKPTNGRLTANPTNSQRVNNFNSPSMHSQNVAFGVNNLTPTSSRISSGDSNSSLFEEPLISLAEAARLKKLQQTDRGRECHDIPRAHSNGETQREMPNEIYKERPIENKLPAALHSKHNISMSSIGSSGSSSSVFHSTNEESLNSSLNATLTIESPCNHMVITTGTFQPSREVSKPFEMSDFYKYSTKFKRQSTDVSSGSECSPLTIRANGKSTTPASKIPPPPSPSSVARHSSPAPQQKGIYQPLSPLTCHPLEGNLSTPDAQSTPHGGSWENTPVHQAVPINVTTKRSATLV